MCSPKILGRAGGIEISFEEGTSFLEALAELENLTKDKKSFFGNSSMRISYSGLKLSYNQEMSFEKKLKKLFRDEISFVKQHCLSHRQIEYSLREGETTCLVVEKSLRSGETVVSRGDLVVYGDVNPGAYLKAKGNITVFGALRGVAHITGNGKVYALYMRPSQIRIGKVCSYNKTSENVVSAMAVEENGEIILQSL